jgi:integrase
MLEISWQLLISKLNNA